VGDSSAGLKQAVPLPIEVIAVSIDGGDFLRLLLGRESRGLASMVVSRIAGNTVSGELEDKGSSEGDVGVLLSLSTVATESLRISLVALVPKPLTWCLSLNFSSQPGLLMGLAAGFSGPGMEAK